MFETQIFISRRVILKHTMNSGLLLFPGNEESPMNYAANVYPFRQNSTFLYYWGLDQPSLAAIIDLDSGEEILFGDDVSMDDIVWMGAQPTIAERAAQIGVAKTASLSDLPAYLKQAGGQKRVIHFLPQYRAENKQKLEVLLGIHSTIINQQSSIEFVKAVVKQRSIKSVEEIHEIEAALDITYELHTYAMWHVKPGLYERDIASVLQGMAFSRGGALAFPIIFSIHGETLHNHHHQHLMKAGDLVVNDCGAESALHYAADITRTFPVSGKYSSAQREIYELVLKALLTAINLIEPGVKYRDIHLQAAKIFAAGLKSIGFMKGDVDEAVAQGAHALFFPHGLGHMMGLDVHDMEDLGENYVGYDEETKRSKQFGLAYLRLAKRLEAGYVLTVEPGLYFIPELIDQWQAANRFTDFINYDKVNSLRGFGGVRIEDNVLVTDDGCRVLGKPIPKKIEEIESLLKCA